MGVTTVDALTLETFEGNTRTFLFKFRKKRSRDPFDVSGADKFKFEVERADPESESPFAPIEGFSTDVGADYVNGLVPITVGPTAPAITVNVGSYLWSLTMVTGTTESTLAVGQLEVKERPGFPNP